MGPKADLGSALFAKQVGAHFLICHSERRFAKSETQPKNLWILRA
jgi:hypothetical protein